MIRSARRLALAAASLLLVVTAAACGSATAGGPASGPVKISVGSMPVVTSAALTLGREKGFFSDAGLDLTITSTEAPSMVPSLLSNDIQFAFLNPPAILIARSNGVPVIGVATAARYDKDPAKAAVALMVLKNGAISSPADLVGKTIAVDALGQMPHLSVLNALRSSGVDPADIKFTELPFPSMAAALQSGQVAAAVATEPFMTLITSKGGTVLLPASAGMPPEMPQSLWFTSEEFFKNNKGTVEKFREAIDKSQTYAQEHPNEVRAILPTYAKVDAAMADKIQLPNYAPGYTAEQWNAWYKILKTEGYLKKDTNPSDAYIPQ